MPPSYILSVYRSLLREARFLPHDYLRQFFRVKAQHYFRENIVTKLYRPKLVAAKLRKARKDCRCLRRANDGDRKALGRVLDLAYGRTGKLKHEIMKPYLSNPFEPPPPRIIPAVERSRPPSYSPELATLLTSPHSRTLTKPLKHDALHTPPTLPERANPMSEDARLLGPFSRRREVNIRWRYHTAELKKTLFPLEFTKPDGIKPRSRLRETGAEELKLLEEVECLARSPRDGPPIPKRERCMSTARTASRLPMRSGSEPLPTRFLRRRYRELLSRIPILRADNAAKYGCSTTLSPLALSNDTRASRIGQGTEEDIDWIIRAAAEDDGISDKSNIISTP